MSTSPRIVSLCGSAAALPGYIAILKAMPIRSGIAFVVLTHRRAGTPCWLVDILSRVTDIPVEEILEGTALAPDHIYINPPGQDLTTNGHTFRLSPSMRDSGWPNTFDVFLLSLAHSTSNRAITVILSGMAEDGSAALSTLRLSGGLNYAQSNAAYTDMPDGAIRTGEIDFIGTPAEIAAVILRLPALG